ncbi:TIR domain-containing protein [Stenotrophomonas sp. 1337]|uniref:TIR domain-containing protein n=1 Tax=Stenotrophomonas sp. 1337 TaxID=2817757 RepID=UPI002866E951|nr:TIR domain-containing protein [Stenotrophomonas sp. 1337]MDR6693805.1 hypothetical protein [Stenotrophomonas sp. 1337]
MVRVFISWSGEQSKKYAEAIRDWLPAVIQMVSPYFTPTDIEKGARWSSDIAKELEQSQVGLICVTRDNLHSDWILFEAGALSKSLDKSHVCPVIFGIAPTDLSGPLKQFQATSFERADFHKLISLINAKLGDARLPAKTLDAVFDKWWPDLQARIEQISDASGSGSSEPVRTERELIEEILTINRSMQRLQGRPSIPARAIQELVENHIELHDDQARELSGYQDALELMKKSHKPLVYIAGKYKGISDEMDKLIADLVRLDYDVIGSQSEEEADIPF